MKIYQVDAFTEEVFKGNPAAVCIYDKELDEKAMQSIAMEMNLSETAFVTINNKDIKKKNEYDIRWFTPTKEVPLCGHATLAASEILFSQLNIPYDEVVFNSKSGILKANKDIYGIRLDFPSDEPSEVSGKDYNSLLEAMEITTYKNLILGKKTKKLVIHVENPETVLEINPNYEKMKSLQISSIKGVGITAKSDENWDFISRYFNPWAGVNEDSVTGSVHTLLATYWSKLLNKRELKAFQASKRSGEIVLKLKENSRVDMIGKARVILKGEINI